MEAHEKILEPSIRLANLRGNSIECRLGKGEFSKGRFDLIVRGESV